MGSRKMVSAMVSEMVKTMISNLIIKCHFHLRLLTILRLRMPKDFIFFQITFTPSNVGLLIKHQLHINFILNKAHHMVAQLMTA